MQNNKICENCQKEYGDNMNFCLACGNTLKVKDKIINCEFEFKCPLQWESLQKTPTSDIRFCSSCEKIVYFAHSQDELDNLASEGKCVAFNPNPKKEFEPPPLMGVVMPPPEKPPEILVTMGMPVYPEKYKEIVKKPWWKFWKKSK